MLSPMFRRNGNTINDGDSQTSLSFFWGEGGVCTQANKDIITSEDYES